MTSFISCMTNLLWPIDAIWQHKTEATLAQVMACCLLAPAVTWANVDLSSVTSSDIYLGAISQEVPQPSIIKISLKITFLKISFKSPSANKLVNNRIIFTHWSFHFDLLPFSGFLQYKYTCYINISYYHMNSCYCPVCRTYLIATRFWVVVICPIIKCVNVLEFSFILFDLCLFITIFNFILNYVPIVTFWIFTYHKIWILLIIFCFIWKYWIIYFLTCLEVFWSVVS